MNSDLPALLDEWASSLFRELDYQREADNGKRFADLYGTMEVWDSANYYYDHSHRGIIVHLCYFLAASWQIIHPKQQRAERAVLKRERGCSFVARQPFTNAHCLRTADGHQDLRVTSWHSRMQA